MRKALSVAPVLVACAASATALAATSLYSVKVGAPANVASGRPFTVRVHGGASRKALLYVYLDSRPCRTTTDGEAARDGNYTAGASYFLQKRGGHRVKETWVHAWVTGAFAKSFGAHAGTAAGRRFVCAYLDTPNRYGGYRVTSGHGSTRYTVTG